MISSEYGWTDDAIRELPVARFRQIVTAIRERRLVEGRERRLLVGWQTRTLAEFIASTVQLDPKKPENPLLDAAHQLSLDEDERADLEARSLEPGQARETVRPIENKPGSYERLLGMFGAPQSR